MNVRESLSLSKWTLFCFSHWCCVTKGCTDMVLWFCQPDWSFPLVLWTDFIGILIFHTQVTSFQLISGDMIDLESHFSVVKIVSCKSPWCLSTWYQMNFLLLKNISKYTMFSETTCEFHIHHVHGHILCLWLDLIRLLSVSITSKGVTYAGMFIFCTVTLGIKRAWITN